MWKKLKAYLKYYFFKIYTTNRCIDVPESINSNIIYLVDDWAIVFKCPCGCNEDIILNTLPDASPKWSYKIKKRKINISPSVHRKKGCKSHFWIRKGKIIWS